MNTDSKTNKPNKNLLSLFSYEKKRETLDCFVSRNDGARFLCFAHCFTRNDKNKRDKKRYTVSKLFLSNI
jgi:hypothetical protein